MPHRGSFFQGQPIRAKGHPREYRAFVYQVELYLLSRIFKFGSADGGSSPFSAADAREAVLTLIVYRPKARGASQPTPRQEFVKDRYGKHYLALQR